MSRDLSSRGPPGGILNGTVIKFGVEIPLPKIVPPRYKVRLAGGQITDVAARLQRVGVGDEITVTEWMTPWGQVWYTQRD
jgi:hypothetical protein